MKKKEESLTIKTKGEKGLTRLLENVAPTIIQELGLGAINLKFISAISKEKDNTVFSMKYNIRYRALTIRYHQLAIDKFDQRDDSLMDDLIHEFIHVIVEPLYQAGVDRNITDEHMTTALESTVEHFTILLRGAIKNKILIK